MALSTLNAPSATPAATAEDELGLTPQQLADFERDGASFVSWTTTLFDHRKPQPPLPLSLSLSPLSPHPPPTHHHHHSQISSKTTTTVKGFLVIPDFASPSEVSSLLSRGRHLLATFDPASVASVFSTRDQSASVSAKYFAESASKVSFFFEEGAVVAQKKEEKEEKGEENGEEKGEGEEEETAAAAEPAGVAFDGTTLPSPALPGAFSLTVPKENAVNKIGHALHDEDEAFRAFSRENPRLLALLRSLGYERPTPVQSMYICKPPRLGGEVVPHQDSCFLRTEPRRSVTGCWLALERAGMDNGCLWAVPGSHKMKKVEGEEEEGNGDGGGGSKEDDDDGGGEGGLFLGHGRVFGRRDDGSVGWSDEGRGGEPSGPPELPTEGAVPLEARPGTLVLLDGAVVHFSRANDGSSSSSSAGKDPGKAAASSSRHAYALHFVEGGKGIRWSERNWLQREEGKPFVPVY